MVQYPYIIAHISDLHFSKFFLPKVGDVLVQDLNALQPDLIVVSGDLTLWSKHSEFSAAAAWLRRLHAPKLVVAGNHDVNWFNFYDQIVDRQRLFKKYVGDQIIRIFRQPGLTVLGLDSTMSFRIASGRISRPEIRWLEQQVSETPETDVVIVVFHHHALPVPNTGFDPYILQNADKVLALLQQHRVDLLLTGHRHAAFLGVLEDASPHKLIVVNCGTSTSNRFRHEPYNDYNVITINRERIRILQKAFYPNSGEFTDLEFHDFENHKLKLHRPSTGGTRLLPLLRVLQAETPDQYSACPVTIHYSPNLRKSVNHGKRSRSR